MKIKASAALALCVLMTACGTTQVPSSDAAAVAAGTKALLRTFNQPLLASMMLGDEPVTQIIAVDGRKLDSQILKLDEAIALDVGPHEVAFSCVRRGGPDERDYSETMRLNLKPHHEYLVRCSFDTDFGPDGTYKGSFSVKEQRAE